MVGVAAAAASAPSVDLSVAAIEITQGIQDSSGTLPFVGRNSTLVRARIAVSAVDIEEGVAGVDAMLRIYSNGQEIRSSPVFSSNGPIFAPVTPLAGVMDHTLNFHCVPPESDDLDFVVTVNWRRTVEESDYGNNSLALHDRVFGCRRTVDIAYVPIDYTLGGGLPDPAMIEPGMGDNFLRSAFRVGEWNYHRSPQPPLVWTTNVNSYAPFLLNALNDIRQNQIPAAGFARPEFIYGWLKGNPFNANGQANGIPGAAAFGNTDPAKFQRTFAHEIGHCWGQPHNTSTIGVYGVDVEAQLADPLGIQQLMPPDKKDVMYAAQNTVDAWVNATTALDVLYDPRSQCAGMTEGSGGADGDGGASDAPDRPQQVLRVAGLHDHAMRRVALDPCAVHDAVVPTADDPRGNVVVESYSAEGMRLAAVRIDTRACRDSCAEPGHLHRATALYANLPRFVDGVEAARVVVRECVAGQPERPLAELWRSAHAPAVGLVTVEWLAPESSGGDDAGSPAERIRVLWNASDADGDALVADILYTPDGARWIPLAVSQPSGPAGGSFEFDASTIPASRGANGRIKVRARDGLGQGEAETPQGLSFGSGNPPDVHLLSPNAGTTVPYGATVVLHASAWDLEDEFLPEESVRWTSSIDGLLGVGRVLPIRELAVGQHVITLRGTDLDGFVTEREVAITVVPRTVITPDITGDGLVNAADVSQILAWWGFPGPTDIDLSGDTGASDLSLVLGAWTPVEQ